MRALVSLIALCLVAVSLVPAAFAAPRPASPFGSTAKQDEWAYEKDRAVIESQATKTIRDVTVTDASGTSRVIPGYVTTRIDGVETPVPNPENPTVVKAKETYERKMKALDLHYDEISKPRRDYGVKTFEKLRKDGIVLETGGKNEHFKSDFDVTFKRSEDLHAFVKDQNAKGLRFIERRGGLYYVDYVTNAVVWSPEATPEQRRKAMADREFTAVTAGARHKLTKGAQGVHDKAGQVLDHCKKYSQSAKHGDLYTQNKTVRKSAELVFGDEAAKVLGKELQGVTDKYRKHLDDTRSLDTFGYPPESKKLMARQIMKMQDDVFVRSYTKAFEESASLQLRRVKRYGETCAKATEARKAGNHAEAARLDRLAAGIKANHASIDASNAEALAVIKKARPDLYRRLIDTEVEVYRDLDRKKGGKRTTKEIVAEQTRDRRATKTTRALVDAPPDGDEAAPPSVAAPVAKTGLGTRLRKFGESVVATDRRVRKVADPIMGLCSTVSTYADIYDRHLEAEARGEAKKGDLVKSVAKAASKDVGTRLIARKVPAVGSLLELIDIPGTVIEEQRAEMDRQRLSGGGSTTWAKTKGTWNAFKKLSCIGSIERIMHEEGRKEVERVSEGGSFSYLTVLANTVGRSIIEVGPAGALTRFVINRESGHHEALEQAAFVEQGIRGRAHARAEASLHDLRGLRQALEELQLAPDAHHPHKQAIIRSLEAAYERAAVEVRETAGKLRRHYGGEDLQVAALYERSGLEKGFKDADLLRARIIQTAGTQDTTNPFVYERLAEMRETYRKKTAELAEHCKGLQLIRDPKDPHVRDLHERLDEMERVLGKADAIDGIRKATGFEGEVKTYRQHYHVAPWWEPKHTMTEKQWNEASPVTRAMFVERQEAAARLRAIQEDGAARHRLFDALREGQKKGRVAGDLSADALVGGVVRLRIATAESAEGPLDMQRGAEVLLARVEELRLLVAEGRLPADADLVALAVESLEGELPADPATDGATEGANADAPLGAEGADDPAGAEDGPAEGGEDLDEPEEAPEIVSPPVPPVQVSLPGGLTRKDSTGRGVMLSSRWIDGESRTWRSIDWFPDGKVRQEQTFVLVGTQMVRHGVHTSFAEGGIPRASESYERGRRHGLTRQWNRDGTLARETSYRADRPHGPTVEYGPEGRRKSLTEYRDGVRHGRLVEWRPDGTMLRRSTYENGRKQGPVVEYFPNGKSKVFTEYDGDRRHGRHRKWHPSGTLALRATYRAEKLHGEHVEWHDGGCPKTQQFYREGRLHGPARRWSTALPSLTCYVDGQAVPLETYRAACGRDASLPPVAGPTGPEPSVEALAAITVGRGKPFELVAHDGSKAIHHFDGPLNCVGTRLFDTRGTLTVEHSMRSGRPHGLCRSFTDGKPREEGTVWMGRATGRSRRFDREGRLVEERIERDGWSVAERLFDAATGRVVSETLAEGGEVRHRRRHDPASGHLTYHLERDLSAGTAPPPELREKRRSFTPSAATSRFLEHPGRPSVLRTFHAATGKPALVEGRDAHGHLHGDRRRWHGNGKLLEHETWAGGALLSRKSFSDEGLPEEEITFVPLPGKTGPGSTAPDGIERRWFVTGPGKGKIRQVQRWVAGVAHGMQETFGDDGHLLLARELDMGVPHGVRREYWRGGRPRLEERHEKGVLHGPQRSWHENGVLASELNRRKGVVVGWARTWHATGGPKTLMHHGPDGALHGPHFEYLPEGRLHPERYVSKGRETRSLAEYLAWRDQDPGLPAPRDAGALVWGPLPAGARPPGTAAVDRPLPPGLAGNEAYAAVMRAWGAGNEALEQGRFAEAEGQFRLALVIAGRTGQPPHTVAVSHEKIAQVYEAEHRYAEAAIAAEACIAAFAASGTPPDDARRIWVAELKAR